MELLAAAHLLGGREEFHTALGKPPDPHLFSLHPQSLFFSSNSHIFISSKRALLDKTPKYFLQEMKGSVNHLDHLLGKEESCS